MMIIGASMISEWVTLTEQHDCLLVFSSISYLGADRYTADHTVENEA